MSLDPAGLQVLISRLAGIADEMGAALRRSASSPNIKERADCSAAVFTPEGELLAQAEHIPVHLGSMPASVRAALDVYAGSLGPGDHVVVNDPFAGGTHLNDITVVTPAYAGETLVGWVANRAHHADVGGSAPGSIPADATEIHQEGFRIPPTRYSPELRGLLLAASRTPDERAGDLDAQVGANVVGALRLAAMDGAPLHEVVAYGERRMRAVLADLPDGSWRFDDVLDSTGSAPDQQTSSGISVTVTVLDDDITFDFTGSAPQSRGNVNAVEAVTVSAVAFALRSAVDPAIPANAGSMRPVHVIAPPGSIVAAQAPAAVGAGNVEVSQRVADVCLGALAQVLSDRVGAANQGTMNNLLLGGDGWVYYETVAGGEGGHPTRACESGVHTGMTNVGQVDALTHPGRDGMSGIHTGMTNVGQVDALSVGGRDGMSGIHTGMTNVGQVDALTQPGRDGMSGIHTGMTNVGQVDALTQPGRDGMSGIHTGMTNSLNTPIEVLERTFPVRVLRYRLRKGSGGVGRFHGGEGIERDLQVLEDCTVSLITERRVSQPWGLQGGGPGAVGENWILPGGYERLAKRLPDKCTLRLHAGDVIRMLTPGGGGWGPAS